MKKWIVYAIVLIILVLTVIVYAHFRNDEPDSSKYANDADFCKVDNDCVVDCGGTVNKIYLKEHPSKTEDSCPTVMIYGTHCTDNVCVAEYDSNGNAN